MGSLFGCGPAVVALTTGMPLPIISAAIVRGGDDPAAIRPSELVSVYLKLGWRMSAVAWWTKRCSGPTVAAWGQVTPGIERGTQFVALVEDPARDRCHWIAVRDEMAADSLSGSEWLPVADCEWLIRSIWRIEPG
jgi:hypothetical protein